jgi:ketosteroid isomerase-like protein
VEAGADTAIELGKYTLVLKDRRVADAGKYLVVWKQQGGAWKLYRDVWNTSQPA